MLRKLLIASVCAILSMNALADPSCDAASVPCGAGDSCCPDQRLNKNICFNPSTHRCLQSYGTSSIAMLCGINDFAIGDVCIDSVMYKYCGGSDFVRCGTNDKCCKATNVGGSNVCYNPDTHNCFNMDATTGAGVLCAATDRACGNVCYSTSTHTCLNGILQPLAVTKRKVKHFKAF